MANHCEEKDEGEAPAAEKWTHCVFEFLSGKGLIDGAGQTLLLFLLEEATHPAWPLSCLVRRLGASSCSGEGDVSDGECRPDEVGGGRGGGQARTFEPDGGSFLHFVLAQCLLKTIPSEICFILFTCKFRFWQSNYSVELFSQKLPPFAGFFIFSYRYLLRLWRL